ncbi:MAG: sulfite exporter TauE/SafE family protein [bacterium]
MLIVYILVGITAGMFGGFFGLGGGVIIIPALICLFKYSQHQAQGTAIATLLPPIGLLAALKYYRSGYVHVKPAIFISLGFFIGGYLGALIATRLSADKLRFCFACLLLILSLRLLFSK